VRLGKVFVVPLVGVESLTLVALGVVAHRVDLWVDWQIAIAPAALLAGVVALSARLLATLRAARQYTVRLPDLSSLDASARAKRTGGSGPLARRGRAPVPEAQRADAPVAGTNRP
jgi:hypothetical protein